MLDRVRGEWQLLSAPVDEALQLFIESMSDGSVTPQESGRLTTTADIHVVANAALEEVQKIASAPVCVNEEPPAAASASTSTTNPFITTSAPAVPEKQPDSMAPHDFESTNTMLLQSNYITTYKLQRFGHSSTRGRGNVTKTFINPPRLNPQPEKCSETPPRSNSNPSRPSRNSACPNKPRSQSRSTSRNSIRVSDNCSTGTSTMAGNTDQREFQQWSSGMVNDLLATSKEQKETVAELKSTVVNLAQLTLDFQRRMMDQFSSLKSTSTKVRRMER